MSAAANYPIEVTFPVLSPHEASACGVPYVHTFDSGMAGPHVMINALTHGNEVCGAIVVDLPLEESGELRRVFAKHGLAFPMLVTPTTPATRAAKLHAASEGFTYLVSRLGVTSAALRVRHGAHETTSAYNILYSASVGLRRRGRGNARRSLTTGRFLIVRAGG